MTDPANPTRQSDWRSIAKFVALAILLHVAAVPLLEPLLPVPEPFDPNALKPRKIRLVSGSAVPRAKVDLPKMEREEPQPKDPEQEKKDDEPVDMDGQVVDVPPMADDTAPDESEFLSEYNTKVERETVSRFRQPPNNAITNEVTKTAEDGMDAPQETTALNIGPAQEKQEKKEAQAPQEDVFELPQQDARDKLALELDPLGLFKNQKERELLPGTGKQLKLSLNGEKSDSQEGRDAQAPKRSTTNNLIPSMGVLAKIAGAPMNDHIEGVDEGDGTFLNTREFKYASFFNRMKRGIAQHWQPQREYRRRDPTGNIYGVRTRTTVLEVTLKSDGSLEDVEVTQSSGLDFLDNVAISAMRSAQPFPNPPKGMMNEDGYIVFGFGFTLDFGARGVRLPF